MLPPESGLDVPAIVAQLERTQPWVRFLSIFGFASAGFMIVGGLIGGAVGAAAGNMDAVVLLFLYPLLGVVYLYPRVRTISQCASRVVGQHGPREFATCARPTCPAVSTPPIPPLGLPQPPSRIPLVVCASHTT